ncbi:MAG: hypothetical protein AB7O24_32535 [Kofleriaceae bacterium]
MRAPTWLLIAAIVGCRPSATVENTMPVANLQAFRTVALNVRSTAFASQGRAQFLEQAVVAKMRQHCAFAYVGRPGQAPADVMLDLNITNAGRGSSGWGSPSSVAMIDTLLVLSDGQSGELLGTARIQGKSSGTLMGGAPSESEAVDEIAKSIANLLAKSGCAGPRLARVDPTPPPPGPSGQGSGQGSGSTTATPDDARRAEAEALNEQGKEKLRSADIAGALAAFQQANTVVPDAKYQFNVCMAFEAGEQWANAQTACQQARSMNPDAKLLAKIDRRLELLAQRP